MPAGTGSADRPAAIGTVSVVAEWENAGKLVESTTLANILNLAERILEAENLIAGRPTLVMVSDPLVNSRSAFDETVARLKQGLGDRLRIETVDAPHGEYVDQKIAGLNATASDIVVFVDSDCAYQPGWLAAMIEPLRDGAVDFAYGRVYMTTDDIWGQAAAIYWFYPCLGELQGPAPAVIFNSLAIRRSAYRRHPFPSRPGNRVACAVWTYGLRSGVLNGVGTFATTGHPPARGLAAVLASAVAHGFIDDSRYVARGYGRPARLFFAVVRLIREILHTLKRSVYVAVKLRLDPLRAVGSGPV